MKNLQKYASFIKLEHTLFSIPLLFAGAILAEFEWPSIRVALLILLAGAGGRIVALVLNRIIDRKIDQKNPRTKNRHLAGGSMTLWEAFFAGFFGLFVYLLSAWVLSDFCLKLSWIPLLAFTAYPYFKRFTKWTHMGLGLVWALVPMGGYFAVRPSLEGISPVLILGTFCVFWLAGFDIIYATLDEEFDRKAGIHSLPSAWGSDRALRLSGLFHVFAFVSLIALYLVWLSGPLTVMLLFMVGILLYIEQKFSRYVDLAFFQINVFVGFMVLFFIWAGTTGV